MEASEAKKTRTTSKTTTAKKTTATKTTTAKKTTTKKATEKVEQDVFVSSLLLKSNSKSSNNERIVLTFLPESSITLPVIVSKKEKEKENVNPNPKKGSAKDKKGKKAKKAVASEEVKEAKATKAVKATKEVEKAAVLTTNKAKRKAKKAELKEAKRLAPSATLKNARISARKVKIVIDNIRGKNVNEAIAILKFTPKAASPLVEKLLKSAIANAENNSMMDKSKLYVAEVYANQGTTMKRIRAATQGRANRIRKRTSHITIVLKERA